MTFHNILFSDLGDGFKLKRKLSSETIHIIRYGLVRIKVSWNFWTETYFPLLVLHVYLEVNPSVVIPCRRRVVIVFKFCCRLHLHQSSSDSQSVSASLIWLYISLSLYIYIVQSLKWRFILTKIIEDVGVRTW